LCPLNRGKAKRYGAIWEFKDPTTVKIYNQAGKIKKIIDLTK